jgi:hypothetical protein
MAVTGCKADVIPVTVGTCAAIPATALDVVAAASPAEEETTAVDCCTTVAMAPEIVAGAESAGAASTC